MRTLDELYASALSDENGDTVEHLPLLQRLARDSATVVELGVFRGASSVALLSGCQGDVYSYDIRRQPEVDEIQRAAKGRWVFREADSIRTTIPECDFLFIDSWHTGEHLTAELELHGPRVRRWIALHDTETFGARGEDGKPGLWGALTTWLESHPEWRMAEHHKNNNGLTILERR